MPTDSTNLYASMAETLCELFAEQYELTTDYVYAEFANPGINTLDEVNDALHFSSFLVYKP